MNTCCICKKEIKGYGENAEPIKKGTCCFNCNAKYVIPSRLLSIALISENERKQRLKEIKAAALKEGEPNEKIRS